MKRDEKDDERLAKTGNSVENPLKGSVDSSLKGFERISVIMMSILLGLLVPVRRADGRRSVLLEMVEEVNEASRGRTLVIK